VKYVIGYRCQNCQASYCSRGHKKALKFNIWSGYEKSVCPRCGATLGSGKVLLKTAQVAPGSGIKSITEPIIFQKMLEMKLEKHQKSTRLFLRIAGFCTVFIFVFSIILGLLGNPRGSTSPALNSLYMLLGIISLGVLAWPFWLYHLMQRTRLKNMVTALPPPGRDQLEYAVRWYEKRGWIRLPAEPKNENTIQMQKKKRFNIFVGIFFMLFGLIGLFIYLGDLKKPGPTIELTLEQDGSVKIV
jgi:hypothetical protein